MQRRPMHLLALGLAATAVLSAAGCGDERSPAAFESFDRAITVAGMAFAALWIFAFGAAVGSFLNVVAYRLPRGYSLSHPGSFCPRCRQPIRWRDNLPVLGWFWLRGKCRACHAAISPRYPLVEAALGAAFLLLAAAELSTGGANIPRWTIDSHEAARAPFSIPLELLAFWAFHAWLISLLAAWALIAYDRHPTPRTLFVLGVGVGLVASCVWPQLLAIPWRSDLTPLVQREWVNGLTSAAIGLGVGIAAGVLIGDGAAGMLAVIGVHLGWQAALATAVVTGAMRLPMRLLAIWNDHRPPTPTPVYLAMTTLWHVLLWQTLVEIDWWPGPRQSWLACVIWWLSLTALGVIDRWQRRDSLYRNEAVDGWLWMI